MGFVRSACERGAWKSGRLDLNHRDTIHDAEFFNDKEPNTSINPDEAVEYIAAVQDTIHTGEGSSQCRTCCIGRDSFAHGSGDWMASHLRHESCRRWSIYEIGDNDILTWALRTGHRQVQAAHHLQREGPRVAD